MARKLTVRQWLWGLALSALAAPAFGAALIGFAMAVEDVWRGGESLGEAAVRWFSIALVAAPLAIMLAGLPAFAVGVCALLASESALERLAPEQARRAILAIGAGGGLLVGFFFDTRSFPILFTPIGAVTGLAVAACFWRVVDPRRAR